ncbi:MAG: hypothetical protein RL026_1091 [Pseudomonadota bacterium]
MISRRHLNLLIALLLPLMVVRGLLPTGYMAVAEGGKLHIVMCSAGLVLPGDTDSGSNPEDHRVPDSGNCLFAHAAKVAPPVEAMVALAPAPVLVPFPSDSSTSLPPATGPPRIAAARAPPAFRT